jgi:hypothetical protein
MNPSYYRAALKIKYADIIINPKFFSKAVISRILSDFWPLESCISETLTP